MSCMIISATELKWPVVLFILYCPSNYLILVYFFLQSSEIIQKHFSIVMLDTVAMLFS